MISNAYTNGALPAGLTLSSSGLISGTPTTAGTTSNGLTVSSIASTPYAVAVGGTDVYYSNYASDSAMLRSQVGTYWNLTGTASPVVRLLLPARNSRGTMPLA